MVISTSLVKGNSAAVTVIQNIVRKIIPKCLFIFPQFEEDLTLAYRASALCRIWIFSTATIEGLDKLKHC
jgi:hypothetical protein